MNPIKLFRKNPEYLRSAVFGANDGLVTTFAVVAGAAGAGLSPSVVVILGCSNVLADGISMALGDYLVNVPKENLISTKPSKVLSGIQEPLPFSFSF